MMKVGELDVLLLHHVELLHLCAASDHANDVDADLHDELLQHHDPEALTKNISSM